MPSKVLAIALFSVLLSAVAQLSLKIGSSAALAAERGAAAGSLIGFFRDAVLNPHVMLGFALYGAGALTWLLVLSRVELSLAYPFVALGLVVTMSLGVLVLQEPVSPAKLAGALLIVTGVFIIARS
jgi:drug/metabolite transporter (DMT)-like permease